MTYMPLRTVTIDLGNLRGQIFSRTEFAPSGGGQAGVGWLLAALRGALSWRVPSAREALRRTRRARCTERVARRLQA